MQNPPLLSKGHVWFNTISIAIYFGYYFLSIPSHAAWAALRYRLLQFEGSPFLILGPSTNNKPTSRSFLFSFLCIFAHGSLLLLQPKLNCDTEYWLRGLFSPSLQERLYLIWAKVLYSREGELHVNDLPPGWREVFGRCLNSKMRDFMAQRFDNNLTSYYFPHTL